MTQRELEICQFPQLEGVLPVGQGLELQLDESKLSEKTLAVWADTPDGNMARKIGKERITAAGIENNLFIII
ncbi:hypothetical protein A3E45_02335 [Candidatus Daviesbacteria bacterium RIFCSPHIGHO2_12_FULL_43_11]|uniref:Uncharacterized protein n=1 Tax=Candidatus Daviesbacteria bacterium RIFCSPHIGHO2_12_FULL_43_11 TaxID=1797780 RepID=A0A1F5K5N3_9BACT|nr:MAG: hypothetical protein A2874_03855 [Candidatus Daviesbacteria bacterium RIFCSPHIGHO2_01_FULL_43_17]OGE36124.1 MAG: hypothetical protein A3E45_02335 [Candidatus Daviesbacteria bacterium RIFCSPHIGHO2_12_FULL_43_11]